MDGARLSLGMVLWNILRTTVFFFFLREFAPFLLLLFFFTFCFAQFISLIPKRMNPSMHNCQTLARGPDVARSVILFGPQRQHRITAGAGSPPVSHSTLWRQHYKSQNASCSCFCSQSKRRAPHLQQSSTLTLRVAGAKCFFRLFASPC